jgi:hypothetical protein
VRTLRSAAIPTARSSKTITIISSILIRYLLVREITQKRHRIWVGRQPKWSSCPNEVSHPKIDLTPQYFSAAGRAIVSPALLFPRLMGRSVRNEKVPGGTGNLVCMQINELLWTSVAPSA